MTVLDWTVVALYLLAALAVGIVVSRKAGESEEEYFVGGRRFPWWLAGTSMVATTFAADTPLAVAGLVASGGIAGNWIWWAAGIGHVVTAVVFARWWRRLAIVTDAEVLERRYSGRPAAWLRALKAAYEAVFINCLAMGWVILAMRKISTILFPAYDPALVTIGLVAIAVLYSTLGGIRSVVITDLAQFVIAMVTAVLLCWLALDELDGVAGLVGRIEELYPDRSASFLSFVPHGDLPGLPITLFAVLLTVGWWRYGQGSGYIVQRLSSVRTSADAERAGVWFAVLHNAVRPWPWILVGLVALVVWPLSGGECATVAQCAADYACVEGICRVEDREATYVMLMTRTLPPGLLGLMVAGMLAAFMSTIDTHVNWGSSYIVRDFWQRWVDPDASSARLVLVGRVSVVLMAVLATSLSFAMTSIAAVWVFLITLGSGMGSVAMAKWLWWRVNAWAEIAAIVAATVLAVGTMVLGSQELLGVANPLFVAPIAKSTTILVVAFGSIALWLPLCFLAGPTDPETLRDFHDTVRPPAVGWRPFAGDGTDSPRLMGIFAKICLGLVAVYGTLFGLGALILGGSYAAAGWGASAVAITAFVVLLVRARD